MGDAKLLADEFGPASANRKQDRVFWKAGNVFATRRLELLTAAQLKELQDSGVTGLHACSSNGRPWRENPAAVRGLAATLRGFRAENSTVDDLLAQ